MGHDVGDGHGDRPAQTVDQVSAQPSRYPGREGGDDDLVEILDIHRIEDRLIRIGIAHPGFDNVDALLLELAAGGIGFLPSEGARLTLGPTGQVLDGGGWNEENHFSVIALRRGSDRSEEFIGFSRLVRHSEQTCHHTPRSDNVNGRALYAHCQDTVRGIRPNR